MNQPGLKNAFGNILREIQIVPRDFPQPGIPNDSAIHKNVTDTLGFEKPESPSAANPPISFFIDKRSPDAVISGSQ
jgi:hypothetical protein